MVKIFISYRRADSNDESRRIYDALIARFDEQFIFRDKDTIPKGEDFRAVIERYVIQSDEMLVLIGQSWLDVHEEDEPNRRRIDNPEDFVRIEIELGLRHCKRVTPIILPNAQMPKEHELPTRLAQLSFQNGYFLRSEDFESDLKCLIEDIEKRHSSISSSPLIEGLDQKRAKADWILLSRLWTLINFDYIDNLNLETQHETIDYDKYSKHIYGYIELRKKPQNKFHRVELEKAFSDFDKVINEFRIAVAQYFIRDGDELISIRYTSKIRDTKEGYDKLLEQFEICVDKVLDLVEQNKRLTTEIRGIVPDFFIDK